jgi:hypothetical protein
LRSTACREHSDDGEMSEPLRVETDHNVYILGAGFSVEAGIPAVAGFLDALRDSLGWLESQPRREAEATAVRNVLEFRRLAAAASDRVKMNVDDIEELFSLASATPGDEYANYVTTAIAATIDYCRSGQPRLSYQIDTGYADSEPPPPRKLGAARSRRVNTNSVIWDDYEYYAAAIAGMLTTPSKNGRNTVITFNYDTVLEEGLEMLGVPVNYNVSVSSRQGALRILKLHGSVNWINSGFSESSLDTIKEVGRYADVLAAGERAMLLPPTWRKQFGGGLSRIWDASVNAISEATRLIVIGFSLPATDSHFKYLLAAGLRDNIALRKIVFVNPVATTELKPRLEAVLRAELFERGLIVLRDKTARAFFTSRSDVALIGRPFPAGLSGDPTSSRIR